MIESARILSPQFDDAVLYFTGAQIELLRNVAGYLRRLETYTAEYHQGYYLTPTAEDYDTILAIVANLEETLMGNPNTLFGIKDVQRELLYKANSVAGEDTLWFASVPEDEVWRIESIHARNADTSNSLIHIRRSSDLGYFPVADFENPAADTRVFWKGMLTLEAGTAISIVFSGCTLNDALWAGIQGYKMAHTP